MEKGGENQKFLFKYWTKCNKYKYNAMSKNTNVRKNKKEIKGHLD